jgi:hypothetical protein
MTASRRIRMLPMPAKRKDDEGHPLPPILPRPDHRATASLYANVIVGAALLAITAGAVLTYWAAGPASW